ncbi:hypothetical protein [Acaryochloris marina]|uniref:Uncharacterized protein n=1 Tax=Acaryochloris marina (strain MBIC 11017) TaxID=329726 RepID=B0C8T3_ACAM1|nr:hypothetical protein [Acaryochloris marina]ABW25323.1 hypothetical protein AM1_0237 [Acaryochloris marina MBIC11017]
MGKNAKIKAAKRQKRTARRTKTKSVAKKRLAERRQGLKAAKHSKNTRHYASMGPRDDSTLSDQVLDRLKNIKQGMPPSATDLAVLVETPFTCKILPAEWEYAADQAREAGGGETTMDPTEKKHLTKDWTNFFLDCRECVECHDEILADMKSQSSFSAEDQIANHIVLLGCRLKARRDQLEDLLQEYLGEDFSIFMETFNLSLGFLELHLQGLSIQLGVPYKKLCGLN